MPSLEVDEGTSLVREAQRGMWSGGPLDQHGCHTSEGKATVLGNRDPPIKVASVHGFDGAQGLSQLGFGNADIFDPSDPTH
jgi:hypothetical protein